jgi:hypothetical protein
MLEIARPETRTHVRSDPERIAWGTVDVILGVVMFPFAVWMWVIERMVMAISALQRS